MNFTYFAEFANFAEFVDFVGTFLITSLTTSNINCWRIYNFSQNLQISQNSQMLLEPTWPPLALFFTLLTNFTIFRKFWKIHRIRRFQWGLLHHLSHYFYIVDEFYNFLPFSQNLQFSQNSQILLQPCRPPLSLLLYCWRILQFFAIFAKFAEFADFVGALLTTSLTTTLLHYWQILQFLAIFAQFAKFAEFTESTGALLTTSLTTFYCFDKFDNFSRCLQNLQLRANLDISPCNCLDYS